MCGEKLLMFSRESRNDVNESHCRLDGLQQVNKILGKHVIKVPNGGVNCVKSNTGVVLAAAASGSLNTFHVAAALGCMS